ncbi:MAG: hypothetical protein V7711_11195 [Pseudomonadales bacterium]
MAPRSVMVGLAIVVSLLLLGRGLLALPVNLLINLDEEPKIKLLMATGTLASGHVLVEYDNRLLRAGWDWCPAVSPLRWCYDIGAAGMQAHGKLNVLAALPVLKESIIELGPDFQWPGILAAMRSQATVSLSRMEIQADCKSMLASMVATADFRNIEFAGQNLGPHSLKTELTDEGAIWRISGQSVNGDIRLDERGAYLPNLDVQAGSTNVSWTTGGALPC